MQIYDLKKTESVIKLYSFQLAAKLFKSVSNGSAGWENFKL